MSKVLVTGHGLHNRDHEAEIERIGDTHKWYFYFSIVESNNRKVHILDDSGSSTIHLLYEFPYSFVDNKIVLFFFDIVSQYIFVVE